MGTKTRQPVSFCVPSGPFDPELQAFDAVALAIKDEEAFKPGFG